MPVCLCFQFFCLPIILAPTVLVVNKSYCYCMFTSAMLFLFVYSHYFVAVAEWRITVTLHLKNDSDHFWLFFRVDFVYSDLAICFFYSKWTQITIIIAKTSKTGFTLKITDYPVLLCWNGHTRWSQNRSFFLRPSNTLAFTIIVQMQKLARGQIATSVFTTTRAIFTCKIHGRLTQSVTF